MKKAGFAWFFAVAAMATFSVLGVRAQQAGTADASSLDFTHVDKNGDDLISRSEIPKSLHDLRSHFDQYDTNHDHRLSQDEYADFLASMNESACRSDQHIQSARCQLLPVGVDPMRNGFSNIPKVTNNPPKVPVNNGK